MDLAEFKKTIQEKRDALIVALLVLMVLLLVVFGYKMQKNYSSSHQEEESVKEPERVTFRQVSSEGEGGQGSGGGTGGQAANQVQRRSAHSGTTYFLKPSPEEVLTLIQESGQAELPKENQEYMGFRVMWPCYFFEVQQLEGARATVMFDLSEDGFGATVVTEVDTTLFPDITTLEPGQKLWLAGEIIGIDPTGTGTFHLVAEEVRFEEGLIEAVGNSGTIREPRGQGTK